MPPCDPETAHWFTEHVHPHDAQLKAYLRGAFPAVRDVEDVVQESYLRVWRVRDGADPLGAGDSLYRGAAPRDRRHAPAPSSAPGAMSAAAS